MDTESGLVSDQELAAIESRAERATPGPWHVRFLDDTHAANLVAISTQPDTDRGERLLDGSAQLEQLSKTLVAATLVQHPVRYINIADRRWDENADFIANARRDVPKLVREVKRLRKLVGESH